jgi:hypothetical protein
LSSVLTAHTRSRQLSQEIVRSTER